MRKPQPTFVVEYKGGRRQKRSPNTSIWGAMDFTSLVREIEEALPSETNTVVKPLSSGNEPGRARHHELLGRRSAEPEAEEEPHSTSLETERVVENDDGGDVQDKPNQGEVRQYGKGGSTEAPISSADHLASRLRRPNGHRQTSAFTQDVTVTASADERVSRQQLAAIDAENIRLKTLLRQRLMGENIRLKKMLERFQ